MLASVPGQTIGVNVFSEKLITALDLTRTHVSAAYLIGTSMSGFLLPFAGAVFDRIGARRMIVLATIGLALSLGFMSQIDRLADGLAELFSLSTMRFWIRAGALTVGFFLIRFWGQGVLMMTSRNMIGKWWVAHRGKVFSFGGIAVAVCFSLAPKYFDWLIESIGWREAWLLMALLLFPGFCVVAWLFFRDNPNECRLEADAGLPTPPGRHHDPEFRIVKEFSRKETLKTFSFWVFSLTFATQAAYFTAYSFHVVDVGVDVGMSKAAILNLFLPSAILSAGVSLFVGWACDRWRLKYMLAILAFGTFLAAAGLILGEGSLMPALIIVGFGLGSGCFSALSGSFLPRFYGLKNLGANSGVFMLLIVFGSAVGPFLFSLSRELTESYASAHWTAATINLLLLALSFKANNPQRKWMESAE